MIKTKSSVTCRHLTQSISLRNLTKVTCLKCENARWVFGNKSKIGTLRDAKCDAFSSQSCRKNIAGTDCLVLKRAACLGPTKRFIVRADKYEALLHDLFQTDGQS